MKTSLPSNRTVAALLFLLLPAAPFNAARAQTNPPANNRRIMHQVTEKAFDGKFSLSEDTRRVDANSDLIVAFNSLTNHGVAAPSPRWQQLNRLLGFVQSTMAERAQLMTDAKTIDLAKTNDVTRLNDAIRQFNQKVKDEPDKWRGVLGLDVAAFQEITTGRFDNQVNRLQPYFNLSRWLKGELERSNRDAVRFASSNTVQVTVQAFHSAIGANRHPLHVDGYDHIPSGELQPIDRTGLRMTPAEQQRLAMEVQMAEAAAGSIREIQKSGGDIVAPFKKLLAELKVRLVEIEEELKKGPLNWDADLDGKAVLQALQRVSADANAPQNVRDAATRLLKNVAAFQTDFKTARSSLLLVRGVKVSLNAGEQPNLSGLLFGRDGLLTQLNDFQTAVTGLSQSISGWGARLQEMETDLAGLAVGNLLSAEQRLAVVPAEVKNFVAELAAKFPATVNAVSMAAQLMSNNQEATLSAATLGGTDLEPIWHGEADLVNGTVELTRAGLAPGDEISVKVRYRERSTNGVPGKIIGEESYKVDAVLMGLHRKIDASLIFARGLRGDSTERQWKPNVAATVHWHYRYRNEEGGWHRTWNAVNPGLGLHLASLDQGPDSVEFGTGLNVSLWDGLITGGYGFNLNNHEHPYVFMGLNLLETLDRAKKLKNKYK